MPIKYNVTEKSQPGVSGGGIKKWYATVANDGELSIDDIVKLIEKFSALSEADIRGVIIAMENVIQDNLINGKIIRMDQLGSFYPSLSSKGATTAGEFDASYIKEAKVNYRPSRRISTALKTATFKKAR